MVGVALVFGAATIGAVAAIVAVLLVLRGGHGGGTATLVIINAWPASVAVVGTDIAAVGSNEAVLALRGNRTVVVDAKGCWLLPGFIDNHAHPLLGSLSAFGDVARLGSCATVADIVREMRAFAGDGHRRTVVVGMMAPYIAGLDRHALDNVTSDGDVLVVVTAGDLHSMWASTATLARAGLLSPPNGTEEWIPRGPDGMATGLLKEPRGYGNLVPLMGSVGAALCHRFLPFHHNDTRLVPLVGNVRKELLSMLRSGFRYLAS
jgi:predicted amidohydrolase YtcJ